MTSETSSIAVDIASDKDLTTKLLGAAGLPVPKQESVRSADAAVAAAAARHGMPISVVADDSSFPEIFEYLRRQREGWGVTLIPWRNLREIFGVLRRREILGLLVASLKVLLWIGLILIIVGLVLNFLPLGGTRRRVW